MSANHAVKLVSPSVDLIDSRIVRTSHNIDSSEYGIHGGKKAKGRKENIIVDRLINSFSRLKKIIADGGYRGKLADTVKYFG